MKEIKVAILTKEEAKELKELSKMKVKIANLMMQADSAHTAFWQKLSLEHSLSPGNHYIRSNSIYRQE